MLDFIEFIRFITFLLGIVATIEGAIYFIYYPYFFLPKFERENNIKQLPLKSHLQTRIKMGALMWLSVEKPGSKKYKNIVKHYQYDFYVSQYLKLSQEALAPCKKIYIANMISISSMVTVSLLVGVISMLE